MNPEFSKYNGNNDSTSGEIQRVLVGYQVAVDLWMNQGNQAWAKINTMLVVNSIIIASIGFTEVSAGQQSLFTLFFPITGILICVIWFVHVRRDAAYSDYFVMSARELEEKHLASSVQTLSRGGDFSDGKIVEVEIHRGSRKMQMNLLARLMSARAAATWTIVILVLLYLSILIRPIL